MERFRWYYFIPFIGILIAASHELGFKTGGGMLLYAMYHLFSLLAMILIPIYL